jgi:membrane protease YdiL (CAAX protease family)
MFGYLILISMLAFIMTIKKSWRKNGFIKIGEIQRIHLLFFPATYMLLNFLGNHNVTTLLFPFLHALLLALCVGIFEEVVFRGFVQNYFLDKWEKKHHGIIQASFVSSIIFGGAHLMNLSLDMSNATAVASQVIYASFIGFGFCGVLLRTKSIIPLILIHAGLDAGAFVMIGIGASQSFAHNAVGFLYPILMTAPLALYGFLLMLQHERELEKEKREGEEKNKKATVKEERIHEIFILD